MVVGIKDTAKLAGISIISCCAVLVCTMFLNFYFDILPVKEQLSSPEAQMYYKAQVSTAKVTCLVSGGCLLAASAVMLLFYVKHYIDTHKKELGILKALGYSSLRTAGHFWIFGSCIFIGTAAGFCGAFLLMPTFYELQNEDHILPGIAISFHPSILLYFVILPTAAFALLAVLYAGFKLRAPVLSLLKDIPQVSSRKRRTDREDKDCPFMEGLRKDTLKSRKTLVFFIIFSSFCFSAMTQMSAGMKNLGNEEMGAMMLAIGLVLACTTLFLAVATVIKSSTKTIAMMRVFGYSQRECCLALLSGYRPMSYIGFALGTVYQYVLLRVMVDIVFKDIEGVPAYEFDFPAMLFSLGIFLAAYETAMYFCSEKIKKISVKEIMLE